MTLLVPNVGEGKMLEHAVGKTAIENCRLRLFKSNTTPTSTMTLADLTEATFTGYAAAVIDGSSATVATGAPSSASWVQQTFTCSSATSEAVYGYFVTEVNSSTLMWFERFSDGPYTVTNNGDKIQITPSITLSTT